MYFNLEICKCIVVTSWEGGWTVHYKSAFSSIDACFRPSSRHACLSFFPPVNPFLFNCQSQPVFASVLYLGGRKAHLCETVCVAAFSVCPGCESGVRGLIDSWVHPVNHSKFPWHSQAEMADNTLQLEFNCKEILDSIPWHASPIESLIQIVGKVEH